MPEHAGPSVAQSMDPRRCFGGMPSTVSALVSSDRLHSSEEFRSPKGSGGRPFPSSVFGASKRARNSPEIPQREELGSFTNDLQETPYHDDRPHAPST